MEEAWKSVDKVGGRHPGARPLLKVGDSGSPDVQVRLLGTVRRNDVGDVGIPHGVFKAYHLEAGKVSVRRDLGDNSGRGGPKGGRENSLS